MSYVEKNLLTGESIIHQVKLHWFMFVPPFGLIAFGWYLAAVDIDEGLAAVVHFFGGAGIFIGFCMVIGAEIRRQSTELAVTSKRIIAKFGFAKRQTAELNLSKVESCNLDQSVLGRIFGFGTISVRGTGGGIAPVPNIDDPMTFKRRVMEAVDAAQSNRGAS